jgi:hypothetical protein
LHMYIRTLFSAEFAYSRPLGTRILEKDPKVPGHRRVALA